LSTEKAVELLNLVLNSALHLSSLIEDALDISRIENNKFQIFKEMFDLRTLVQDIKTMLEF
jgi:signal transduction histidine kinase